MVEHFRLVKILNGYKSINIDKIVFMEADDNYSIIYTPDEKYTIPITLGSVESKLKNFIYIFRIHKSYLININFLNEIIKEKDTDSYVVCLEGNHSLPLSRRKKQELLNLLKKL